MGKWDPDPVQNAITDAAMAQVGARELAVRHVEDGDPPWQAYFTDTGEACTFAGIYTYGGETREEALEDTRRIASKWDWAIREVEA